MKRDLPREHDFDSQPESSGSEAPLRPRGSNQVGMRQFNERVVLQALRLHGDLPKAELARVTALTAQTVGLITARLEEDGLLLRRDRVRGKIGQPSVPLGLNPKGAFSIGVKVGRRSTDCLLVDFSGAVQKRLGLAYRFPDAEELLPAIDQNLRTLRRSLGPLASRLVGVGVAVPFHMGGWYRMLGLSKTQSDAWNRIDLARMVQDMTKLPVSYAKDTSAACVAELVQGRGRERKSFLYLYVDTFVGGALVLDSRLHAGRHGNAGAVASLPVTMAHGRTVPEQLVRDASLWELEQVFTRHQLDPMAAYDERAMQAPWSAHTQGWIRSAAVALAHCITSGTAFVDVDTVVLDGSLAREALDALLEATRQALKRYNWEGLWEPELLAGTIGPDARAVGGALLPLHINFAPDSEIFLKSEA